jgi:hypothetical protein
MSLTLEQRLQRLEDIQAITELKAAYCNGADGGWDQPSHVGRYSSHSSAGRSLFIVSQTQSSRLTVTLRQANGTSKSRLGWRRTKTCGRVEFTATSLSGLQRVGDSKS